MGYKSKKAKGATSEALGAQAIKNTAGTLTHGQILHRAGYDSVADL